MSIKELNKGGRPSKAISVPIKEMFIKTYQSDSITNYIKRI